MSLANSARKNDRTCKQIRVLMRDKKEGRKKQARLNNTAHPRQSLSTRKVSCLGWDSNPRRSTTELLYLYVF